ncbi:MAG: hypothetical protein HC781_05675 [Leptolyngbyaceae cyanobacterium CSU_1_4]|nr:hypothetical protein [Leptolyngbyaceae cyanobacterium CSU_1_4]
MGVRFIGVMSLMAIASPIVLIGSANVAQAQSTAQPTAQPSEAVQTIPEAFEEAYFRNSENFYRNRQVPHNVTWFLGPFPENQIAADGRAINRLYTDALAQQASNDPLIRTPDAENPYQSSRLTAPIVPEEEPIPPAFSSPFSRSPVNSNSNSGNSGNNGSSGSGRNIPVPALW